MAFMVPEYFEGRMVLIPDRGGDSDDFPPDLLPEELASWREVDNARTESGWWCRLSAPGYLDCTDWTGPFASEEEARAHLRDTYEVDPDTGDDLDDE